MAFTTGSHIVKRFDEEINNLFNQVLEMGRFVEQQVQHAIEALKTGNAALAEATVAGDERVNRLDIDIEQECIRLLACRQPVSTDMRLILSLSKAVTDFERIGDEAQTIAEQALNIQEHKGKLSGGMTYDVHRLAQLVLKRFQMARDTLAKLDIESAERLLSRNEDEVNDLLQDSLRSLCTYVFAGQPAVVATLINLVLALKALQRVTDHAENLARYVIYIVEGEDVRRRDL